MGKLCAVPRARQGRAGEAGGYREQGAGLALQVPCSQTHCACPRQPASCPVPRRLTLRPSPGGNQQAPTSSLSARCSISAVRLTYCVA